MKNYSIWKDNIKNKKYSKLNEDKEVDVLIIGGGITGVSTLYNLRNSNLNVMLVEQNRVGLSVTGNSTGKLTFLQNDLIDKIRKSFNDDIATKYIKSQIDSIDMITSAINDESIECDLEKVDSYLYTNKDKEVKNLKNLEKFLNSNFIKTISDSIDIVDSKYAFKVNNTYLINPIKLIYGLLNNNKFPIFENTSIKKIEKENKYYICYTDQYKIKTKYIVIASHYPYFIIPYLFPIKGSLEKSYLSASKYNMNPISLISYSNPFISIRNYKDYLIYLSKTHSLISDINILKNFNDLVSDLNNINLKVDYLWSNVDIITNDGLPYIGRLKNNMLIGTGYNTWGLTNGFLAGKILSDIILNKENEYIDLFDPNRFNLKQIIGGISDIGSSISGYFNGYLNKSKETHICPHAYCKLLFNDIEKTWDCPCHGSRFNIDGKCISGPANRDIRKCYIKWY